MEFCSGTTKNLISLDSDCLRRSSITFTCDMSILRLTICVIVIKFNYVPLTSLADLTIWPSHQPSPPGHAHAFLPQSLQLLSQSVRLAGKTPKRDGLKTMLSPTNPYTSISIVSIILKSANTHTHTQTHRHIHTHTCSELLIDLWSWNASNLQKRVLVGSGSLDRNLDWLGRRGWIGIYIGWIGTVWIWTV